jgi:hypothetical protein
MMMAPDDMAAFSGVTLQVHAGATTGAVKPLQGFLAGDGSLGQHPNAVTLVEALSPRMWRFGDLATWLFATSLPSGTKGTRYEVVLDDGFHTMYGSPVQMAPACDPMTDTKCFADFNALDAAWKSYFESAMSALDQMNLAFDYYDLTNEPDAGFSGLTSDQILTLIKDAHDIVRAHRMTARLVGPSTSGWADAPIQAALAWFAANDVHLDALSWHEFSLPETAALDVSQARADIATAFAAKPALAPTEIQVNEFLSGQSHLVPGWIAGYLYYLEQAKVDWASRSCWYPVPNGTSECMAGLDGLFASDAMTPQAPYWVHRFYREQTGNRIAVETSDPHVVVLASRDDTAATVQLLVGRYSCGRSGGWCRFANYQVSDQPIDPIAVRVVIDQVPFASPTVTAQIRHIPALPIALDSVPTTTEMLPVQNGAVTLAIDPFADGDVYSVTLGK